MAASGIKITVDGLEDIKRTLEHLPVLMRRAVLDSALKKGGQLIATRAKQLAPVGSARFGNKAGKKHLRDTIGVVVRQYGENKGVAVVGPQYPAGAHGHLVEYGTKAHKIAIKKTKALADTVNDVTRYFGEDGSVFGKSVNHPGANPRAFLGPAADEMKGKVELVIIEALNKAVDKATAHA